MRLKSTTTGASPRTTQVRGEAQAPEGRGPARETRPASIVTVDPSAAA